MKINIVILFPLLTYALTKEISIQKIVNSKFSNAELINDIIIVAYNGGFSKYSYSLELIEQIPIKELELISYSVIHQIN